VRGPAPGRPLPDAPYPLAYGMACGVDWKNAPTGAYGFYGKFFFEVKTLACDSDRPENVELDLIRLLALEQKARLGRWLEYLLQPGVTLTIRRRKLRPFDLEDQEYTVEVRGEDLKVRGHSAPELEEFLAVKEWFEEREKVCTGCRRILPFSAFGNHKTGKDGKYSKCFACERARAAVNDEKKKKAKAQRFKGV
jgi:hypothetical protein